MSKYFVDENSNEDNSSFENESQPATSQPLSQDQIERMEKNRKRALEIRKNKEETATKIAKLAKTMTNKKVIDSGAGFFLDEDDLIQEQNIKVTQLPPAPTPDQQLICEKCNNRFAHSFLSMNFELNVCDGCRTEHKDDYELITKTDAKTEFLLKDCDFDFREPPLKFIVKKNTHYKKWGEMKLYLKFQCKERAMVVHENEDNLEEKKEKKEFNLHKTRQKNYEKKIKELRKQARQTSKKLPQAHTHDYGEEMYDKKKDVNYKICQTCSYRLEYEEM